MEPEMAINQIQRERECQCVNVQELTENVNLQNLRPKIAHILGVEASSRGLMVSAHRGLGVKVLSLHFPSLSDAMHLDCHDSLTLVHKGAPRGAAMV